MPHERELEAVKLACANHIAAIEKDGQISDDEANQVIDIMQHIEDTYMDLLEKFGIEVGDERVD
jgi:ribosome recycling factor